MSILYGDRVKETTTTTGTGTVNLGGAATGFQSFLAGIGNGNQCAYTIENGTDWEVGLGTVHSGSPNTLTRDTVLSSSNSGALVSFPAGTKNVFATLPAALVALRQPAYEEFVATASQTVFNTTIPTTAKSGTKSFLEVYVNGVLQQEGATKAYTVTGANQITFNTGVTLSYDVVIYGYA